MPFVRDESRGIYDDALNELIEKLKTQPLDRKMPDAAYITYMLLLEAVGGDVNDCIINFGILVDVILCIFGFHFGPLEMQILEARWREGNARLVQSLVRKEVPERG